MSPSLIGLTPTSSPGHHFRQHHGGRVRVRVQRLVATGIAVIDRIAAAMSGGKRARHLYTEHDAGSMNAAYLMRRSS